MSTRIYLARALAGISAVLIFMALHAPIWSIKGPMSISGNPRITYIDLLPEVNKMLSSSYLYAHYLAISTICILIALGLSIVSAVAKRGFGFAMACVWIAIGTAYVSIQTALNSAWTTRLVGSFVRIDPGPALQWAILAGILLIIAWIASKGSEKSE